MSVQLQSAQPTKADINDFCEQAGNDHFDAVEAYLKKYGTDIVNQKNGAGFTALQRAVRYASAEMVVLLLQHGADIHVQDSTGKSLVTYAATKPVLELLITMGIDVNTVEPGGQTLLMWAANSGLPWALEGLIRQGAALNDRSTRTSMTALMYAADHPAALEVLLRHPVDLDAQCTPSTGGGTALMWAVASEQIASVEMLLSKGAKIDVQNAAGETALMIAAKNGYADIAAMLLAKGADPDVKYNAAGGTALFLAQHGKHHEVERILQDYLNGAADVRAQEKLRTQTETGLQQLKPRHAPRFTLKRKM